VSSGQRRIAAKESQNAKHKTPKPGVRQSQAAKENQKAKGKG
jgi:hypothetical protein